MGHGISRFQLRCHRIGRGLVVTNNDFTSSARQLAESSDVELVGRDELGQLINEFNRNAKDYTRLTELMKGGTWAGTQEPE